MLMLWTLLCTLTRSTSEAKSSKAIFVNVERWNQQKKKLESFDREASTRHETRKRPKATSFKLWKIVRCSWKINKQFPAFLLASTHAQPARRKDEGIFGKLSKRLENEIRWFCFVCSIDFGINFRLSSDSEHVKCSMENPENSLRFWSINLVCFESSVDIVRADVVVHDVKIYANKIFRFRVLVCRLRYVNCIENVFKFGIVSAVTFVLVDICPLRDVFQKIKIT